jgi:hypothetical protein
MGIKKDDPAGKTGNGPERAMGTGDPAPGQNVSQRVISRRGRNKMIRYNAAQYK